MTKETTPFTGQEYLFTRDLAQRLMPFMQAEASRPARQAMMASLQPGNFYPFFRFWAQRPWWPLKEWRKPHAQGMRLDAEVFRRVLHRSGLKSCRLLTMCNRTGDVTHYWVTYYPPEPRVVQFKAPPPAPTSEPEVPESDPVGPTPSQPPQADGATAKLPSPPG